MNDIFSKPRSIISAYKCKWMGWFREKATTYDGYEAEKLSLCCTNPDMKLKCHVLFTSLDFCRACTMWQDKDAS